MHQSEEELTLLTEIALLRAHGKSWQEVAGELDVDRARLREITRAHGAVYWRLFEEAQHRASLEAASMARAKLEELLESENERVALRAAQALLGDQRGKDRNATLRDRNDVLAEKVVERQKDAESWRQLREAEMTLAEYRRDVERRIKDDSEPSLWQKAFSSRRPERRPACPTGGDSVDKSTPGGRNLDGLPGMAEGIVGTDNGGSDIIALARAAFDEMTDDQGRLIDPLEVRRLREEKNAEASQSTAAE